MKSQLIKVGIFLFAPGLFPIFSRDNLCPNKEIKNVILPELREELSKGFQPKEPTQYLTRSEVCELLKIDLSTLYRWTKKGDLKAYGIGNRVYYKLNEVEQKLNENQITA